MVFGLNAPFSVHNMVPSALLWHDSDFARCRCGVNSPRILVQYNEARLLCHSNSISVI